MELPSIGKHCSEPSCSQLDFLPFTCQYCKKIYCQDHCRLEGHTCSNKEAATQQDQRVPICPLCNKPVPIKRGEDPNVRMEQHIAAGCPEPATTASKPIYTNSCHAKGCKNRSAIPIICQSCRMNYCLKHRLEADHACAPSRNNGSNNNKKPNGTTTSNTNNSNNNNNNNSGHQNWAQKTANGARSARAAAAAQQRANNSSNPSRQQQQQQHSSSSSAGKKDKDKCTIS